MAERVDVDKEMLEVWDMVKGNRAYTTGGSDTAVVKGTALLGLAVIRLDKTSARLAAVNIFLAVVLVLIGILQLVAMLKGH